MVYFVDYFYSYEVLSVWSRTRSNFTPSRSIDNTQPVDCSIIMAAGERHVLELMITADKRQSRGRRKNRSASQLPTAEIQPSHLYP